MPQRQFPALEIHFTPEAENAFDLRDRLTVGLDDFEPTAVEESSTMWRVFFSSPSSRDAATAWLRTLGDARVTLASVDVDDEGWAERSQADLQPIRVGRIVVTPPWCAAEARRLASETDIVLVVVPSMGFGTGHHASTRLCLGLLQQVPVRGRSVLDIGTGSGVLAIATAHLGARAVLALDNDPDAIGAASETLALNATDVPVRLERGDFRGAALEPADLVLANLTGEMLRRSAGQLTGCVTKGGDVVVSGVLAEEREQVVAAFESAGARLVTTAREDEWVGLRFER